MKKKSVVKPSGSAKVRRNKLASSSLPTDVVDQAALLADLRMLILSARQRIASVANSTYTLLCWQVGSRLLRENLQVGRAAYGKQILATASQELTAQFGSGFSYTALTRMARFAEWMKDEQIVSSLATELKHPGDRTGLKPPENNLLATMSIN